MHPQIEKDYPEWAEEYEKMKSLLMRIYYARVAMDEPLVIKLLWDVDNFFREPNLN